MKAKIMLQLILFFQINTTKISQVKFCEFENSTANVHTIAYDRTEGTLNYCNVIKCKLTATQGIIYFVNSTVTIKNCAILQHQSNIYLVLYTPASVTLINCSIDCEASGFNTRGDESNKLDTSQMGTSSFINVLSLIEYNDCMGDVFNQIRLNDCSCINSYTSLYIFPSAVSPLITMYV